MSFTFDAASVDTKAQMRDDDLRTLRFPDSETLPDHRPARWFKPPRRRHRWAVDAELTMRNLTWPVVLDLAVRGMTVDMQRQEDGIVCGDRKRAVRVWAVLLFPWVG